MYRVTWPHRIYIHVVIIVSGKSLDFKDEIKIDEIEFSGS